MTTLHASRLAEYRADGLVVIPDALRPDDVRRLRAEAHRLFELDHAGRVFEKDGVTVRGVHGCHLVSGLFSTLTRMDQLLRPAEQILGSQVYVHQFKINAKRAHTGDLWPWHQDYIFWRRLDGMREARVLNVGLFLDEVTDDNGPLIFVPGSHRLGLLSDTDVQVGAGSATSDWKTNLSAELEYTLTDEQLAPLIERSGVRSATGPAGSLLFFDPQIVHSSRPNRSPSDRSIALISYNSVENPLVDVARPRPEHLAGRGFHPLAPAGTRL